MPGFSFQSLFNEDPERQLVSGPGATSEWRIKPRSLMDEDADPRFPAFPLFSRRGSRAPMSATYLVPSRSSFRARYRPRAATTPAPTSPRCRPYSVTQAGREARSVDITAMATG